MSSRFPAALILCCAALGAISACSGSDANPAVSASAQSEDVCQSAPVDGFGFDAFGGWKGIEFDRAPRFRVAEVDGVWWLITPDGHALFSNGPTGIDPLGDTIRDTGRSPHLENILARYGSEEAWADATVDRLCALGIRTHGGWLAPQDADLFSGRIPFSLNASFYTAMPEVLGAPASTKPRRDVFVADALELARQVAAVPNGTVRRCAQDPWCIGVYVDNELPWAPSLLAGGSHLDVYLALPADAPGKRALQQFFVGRYAGDVESFNATWGAAIAGFDELQHATRLGSCTPITGFVDDICAIREGADRYADRMAFETLVAARFADLADQALHEIDPLLLNLGPRITAEPAHPDVLRALAARVDVMSINNYDISEAAQVLLSPTIQAEMAAFGLLPLDPYERLRQVYAHTGKPILVSEWFFRVKRSDIGNYPPVLPEVDSPALQAAAYAAYVDAILAMPFVVGEHWFQWVDQPREGRFDGENQLIGIVAIDDELNQPLADTVAATNRTILARRLALRP